MNTTGCIKENKEDVSFMIHEHDDNIKEQKMDIEDNLYEYTSEELEKYRIQMITYLHKVCNHQQIRLEILLHSSYLLNKCISFRWLNIIS